MSGKTTLLSCPFCGGEYAQVRYMGGKWQEPSAFDSGYRGECCDCGVITAACDTEAEAISAWNSRAAHGTLTAEQVRDAIMSADRWKKPMEDTGMMNAHLIIRDDGWQAIADELNATLGWIEEPDAIRNELADSGLIDTCGELGSGTCENVAKGWGEFECSECGMYLDVGSDLHHVNVCPDCSRKVVDS